MANMFKLREAIVGRLETALTEYKVFAFEAPSDPLPGNRCIYVVPDSTFADYQVTLSDLAEWKFLVIVFVGGADEKACHDELGLMLDPNGPLLRALHSEDYDDALTQCAQWVNANAADSFGAYHRNRAGFTTARVKVTAAA